MSQNLERLKQLLAELFQLDQAELDFGIYRIMNAKRDEIVRFLDRDLLPQVREAFQAYDAKNRGAVEAELAEAIEKARELGADPETLPRVKELRAKLAQAVDVTVLENEVYSHLYNFFRRYYQEGDFISLRRYKEGVYAIPYEGEEVKLHWANHDQYYIKTSEYLRNYTFKLPSGKRVHFKLVGADTEKDNNRAQNGNERRFILSAEQPLAEENLPAPRPNCFFVYVIECEDGSHYIGHTEDLCRRWKEHLEGHAADWTKRHRPVRIAHFEEYPTREEAVQREQHLKTGFGRKWLKDLIATGRARQAGGELVLRFEYRPHPDKAKQADLNAAAVDRILNQTTGFDEWRRELASLRPTEKNPNRTLLEKHLTDYTARNTFDYFIHKNLGGFLRRELDFYIKNEVMHLDDIESETAPRVEQYLSKIKAIRRIAHKIIDFLAQIENFQKKLWLKKKFVVETQYCVTLDRVREELYPEIAANDAQREEWVRLFAIDEIRGDMATPGYSKPLTMEFLKANPHLVLDTRHFGEDFKRRLLASFDDLDEQCNGLLIHSENFQALNLLMERYRGQVKCIYIDPPYNTGGDGFAYKDAYQHSSWMSMFGDRLDIAAELLDAKAVLFVHIDNNEQPRLRLLVEEILGQQSFHAMIAWKNKYGPGAATRGIGDLHEHILIFCTDPALTLTAPLDEDTIAQYSGRDAKYAVRGGFVTQPLATRSKDPRPNLVYPLIYEGQEIWPDKQWIWSKDRMEAAIANDEVVFNRQSDGSFSVRFKQYLRDEQGRMRRGKPLSLLLGPFNQDGTKEIEDLFGERVFSFPKPAVLGQRLLAIEADEWESQPTVMDYMAGSGTTAQAIINLNREDGGRRKYILVEMGEYFDTVLVPRIKKVVYSKDWKDGKPLTPTLSPEGRGQGEGTGISHMFKVLRLESYEDTLNNLELKRTEAQQRLLEEHRDFREDYMLRYMLDVESRGSASLLNLDRFEDPFDYKLNIATGTAGETKPTVVDLVETFNYLIGLRVNTIDHIGGVRVVTGTNPQGERVLILWRNTKELDSDALDAWFRKQGYNTKDQEYDLIYVNGDNNLENLRKPDQTWKVRLIEEEFLRRMFDVQDV
jgi:adenine-specific DNA-methyltransferase